MHLRFYSHVLCYGDIMKNQLILTLGYLFLTSCGNKDAANNVLENELIDKKTERHLILGLQIDRSSEPLSTFALENPGYHLCASFHGYTSENEVRNLKIVAWVDSSTQCLPNQNMISFTNLFHNALNSELRNSVNTYYKKYKTIGFDKKEFKKVRNSIWYNSYYNTPKRTTYIIRQNPSFAQADYNFGKLYIKEDLKTQGFLIGIHSLCPEHSHCKLTLEGFAKKRLGFEFTGGPIPR